MIIDLRHRENRADTIANSIILRGGPAELGGSEQVD
jgi:hypothetical protein